MMASFTAYGTRIASLINIILIVMLYKIDAYAVSLSGGQSGGEVTAAWSSYATCTCRASNDCNATDVFVLVALDLRLLFPLKFLRPHFFFLLEHLTWTP